MLILSLFAGWASEFGVILLAFQLLLLCLALFKGVKIPLWYYAGILGFGLGWCVLYFSPGHKNRAALPQVQVYYKSLSQLIAMPFNELFARFCGLFGTEHFTQKLVAIFGVLAFFVLKFKERKFTLLAVILGLVFVGIFSGGSKTQFLFMPLAAVFCFVLSLNLRKNSSDFITLFAMSGLFLMYFLMLCATIQISVPPRSKLPFALLDCALILLAARILAPFVAQTLRFATRAFVCAVCVFYASFVLGASFDMRLKWERMISAIEAQKALGREDIIVSDEIFRSYYDGYTDWGNPDGKATDWPDTSYARYFGVKSFIALPPKSLNLQDKDK